MTQLIRDTVWEVAIADVQRAVGHSFFSDIQLDVLRRRDFDKIADSLIANINEKSGALTMTAALIYFVTTHNFYHDYNKLYREDINGDLFVWQNDMWLRVED